MDKIISARVDESVAVSIGLLAQRLHTSKRSVIECAVARYAAEVEKDKGIDVFEQTCGAWMREESPERLVRRSRKAFRDSMRRHQP